MRFFVHLWDRGWIYRANRIVNWCPFHETAISDLEVAHEEMDDTLTYARYPFADGSGHLTIATVRPATMLADVAVAVHPDDERYRDAVGKEVLVPYVERAVPVIADERVEPDFGTGALKVTPGHDPMDFEIGRDHDLPTITVIGLDGRMNENAGDLAGKAQEEADQAILAWLKEHDRLEKREHYRHSVGTCERCHTRIEPLVSLQWWVAMEEPRKPALEALRERRVQYHPESQHQFAIRSLEEIPDWNISRQLWWGHQQPLWYCPDGHVTCAWPPPEACAECGSDRDRARPRRPRHLVLVGALAVRDAGLAGADARARALLPRRRQLDRARDHPPLGEPDDLDGARGDGRDPVPRRDHPLDDPGLRRPPDVEEPRYRRRPTRPDREVRRRRDPLRAPEDVVDTGRPLHGGPARRGPQAGEQALERVAAAPAGPSRAGGAPARARGALDPRAARRDPGRGRSCVGEDSSSRPPFRPSTTSRSTTSATGTRRRSSRGSASPRRARPRSPRSSSC